MWPEYRRTPVWRQCLFYEKGKLVNERGEVQSFGSVDDTVRAIQDTDCIVFAPPLDDLDMVELLEACIYSEGSTVACTRKGKPIFARIKGKTSSRWIISTQTWGVEECEPVWFLRNIRELYQFYGLGVLPTPSSLGKALMRDVHFTERLHKQGSINLGCEDFIRRYSVGGVVQTPGIGVSVEECSQMDESSSFLNHYCKHPAGPVLYFCGNHHEELATYFAKCRVFVPSDLPVGIFPVRRPRDYRKPVSYPKDAGVYSNIYLWKEQVDDLLDARCYVEIEEGYGWKEFTADNAYWASKAYDYRQRATTPFIAEQAKRVNVAAIGGMGMERVHFRLVPESEYSPFLGDRRFVTRRGEPLNYAIRKEEDQTSAYMLHWQRYTVMQSNRASINMAKPYAEEGRLLAIDHDSVLVVKKDEHLRFYPKGTMGLPYGTWLYKPHTNMDIIANRSWISDQEVHLPGVPRKAAIEYVEKRNRKIA